jgi:hypothetical protein
VLDKWLCWLAAQQLAEQLLAEQAAKWSTVAEPGMHCTANPPILHDHA